MSSLTIRRDNAVSYATLNRPDVRNAFDEHVIAELSAWAQDVASDPSVRVAVLSGAGSTFSAGADLNWMARMMDYSEEENRQDALAMARMFHAVDTLPVPLVGRVQGAALGGGAGLVAVCDIVIAAEDAVFGFTEVKLGLLPAVISPYCVAKIGISTSRELMLTGARIDATRAREIGLVHRVVPAHALDAAVNDGVSELLANAPGAMRATKELISQVAGRDPGDVMETTSQAIAAQRVSPEGQEGLSAFLGKRTPSWRK